MMIREPHRGRKQPNLSQSILSTFSWIQLHILRELTAHATRRYSQLRPKDVEGNLFAYHLKGLIGEGLIEKADAQYRLSAKGLQTAGVLSLSTGQVRRQPKILNAIVCRNEAGEYLMSNWHRQPNIGLLSFPHGMMHYGEAHIAMAQTELAEKAGLSGGLLYRGHVYVRGERDGTLDRHMLVHIFEATQLKPDASAALRPEVSEPVWMRLEDMRREQFVPGFYEIAQLYHETKGPIVADIVVEI
jgi:8-oxo-dGTP pyrophosphatase MutT (NUDIX family)